MIRLFEIMKFKVFLICLVLSITNANSQNVKIEQNNNLSFYCELTKNILKNTEFNYQTFSKSETKKMDIDTLTILSKKPDIFKIQGLSSFLSNANDYEVKIANKEIFFFKAFNSKRNYSESGILTRQSGELVHEITQSFEDKDKEKDITFYQCKIKQEI